MPTKPEKGTYLRIWDLHIRRCVICASAQSLDGLCRLGRPHFQAALEENMSIEELLERRA